MALGQESQESKREEQVQKHWYSGLREELGSCQPSEQQQLVSTWACLLLLRNSVSAQERALPRKLTNSTDTTYSVYT